MYTSTFSLNSALDGVGWSMQRPGRFTPRKRTPYVIYRGAGWAPGPVWTGAENLAPPPPPGFDPRTVHPVVDG
jgi:hypothetical protein